jgi:hypothetical protein
MRKYVCAILILSGVSQMASGQTLRVPPRINASAKTITGAVTCPLFRVKSWCGIGV